MLKTLLWPAYRFLELPIGYALIQRINRPTTDAIRSVFAEHIHLRDTDRVLDLGCGIGGYRACFAGRYHGIDINPKYIESCRRTHDGEFLTMDATQLDFPDASFDAVVTVATTHHLSDRQVEAMMSEAVRVLKPGGSFHILDAVLPESLIDFGKTIWFKLDRGEYPRKRGHLKQLFPQGGEVAEETIRPGVLHDVFYARYSKSKRAR